MRVHEFATRSLEDRHPNDKPFGPESRPRMPAGTVRVDVSDVYDWYKLGQHVSNLKGLGRHDFGKGPPSTIFSFGDEDTEHKYIRDLERTGLTTTDIDPAAHTKKTGQKTDPTYDVDESTVLKAADLVDVFIRGSHRGRILTKLLTRGFPNQQIPALIKILEKRYGINPNAVVYGPSKKVDEARGKKRGRRRFRFGGYFFPGYSFFGGDSAGEGGGDGGGESVKENFADGKKPGRKGLAKRVGVNCKQPVSKLRSIAKNSSGERQRMAHWCANMKSGKNK